MEPLSARRRVELVKSGDAEFFVELVDTGGPSTVGVGEALSFDGVRSAVEAIANEMGDAWRRARPSSASVEFGLSLTAKAGTLTGLLVNGHGEASMKVTLTWDKPGDTAPAD